MTTIGDAISTLFAKYERQFHDEHLAAVATQVALAEVLRKSNQALHAESGRHATGPLHVVV